MVSLATASESLKVWKFENDELNLVSRFSTPTGKCSCLAWNHTNQVVAVGGTESKIFLVQANNGQFLSSLQVSEDNGSKLDASSVAFSSNSRFLAASLNNVIQLWDLKRRQLKSLMSDHVGNVTSTCFIPTGEIVSGDVSGAVRIWDSKAYLSSPELIGSPDSPESVTSLSISPASAAHLASGYSSGYFGIWDTATYRLIRRVSAHSGSLNSLTYSPVNPKLVATAGSDGRVALFDTGSRGSNDPSAVIQLADRVNITSVAFHEDAIHTAIGLSNGRVLVYDWRKTVRPVLNQPAHDPYPVLALAFQTPKGKSDTSASGSVSTAISTSARTTTAPVATVVRKIPETPIRTLSNTTTATAVDSNVTLPSNIVVTSPVRTSLQRLHNVISPIASMRSSSDDHQLPPPPPANTRTPAVLPTQGVENKYALNHSHAFPEKKAEQVSSASTLTSRTSIPHSTHQAHLAPHGSVPHTTAAGAGLDNVYSLNHSRTYPEDTTHHIQHPNTTTSPLHETHTESDKPRSALKHTQPQSEDHSQRSSYPQAQLEVSFDRSVEQRVSVSQGQGPRGAQSTYESPLRATAGRNGYSSTHQEADLSHSHNVNNTSHTTKHHISTSEEDPHFSLKQAVRPVTARDLEESLQLLKYDLHREMQEIIKEQIRQFSIAKDETALMLQEMSAQLKEVLQANKELRAENEYLRRIY